MVVTGLKTIKKLFEVISSNRLQESSSIGNKVKEFTTLSKLKGNEGDLFGSFIGLDVIIMSKLEVLNNILMVKLAHN